MHYSIDQPIGQASSAAGRRLFKLACPAGRYGLALCFHLWLSLIAVRSKYVHVHVLFRTFDEQELHSPQKMTPLFAIQHAVRHVVSKCS